MIIYFFPLELQFNIKFVLLLNSLFLQVMLSSSPLMCVRILSGNGRQVLPEAEGGLE